MILSEHDSIISFIKFLKDKYGLICDFSKNKIRIDKKFKLIFQEKKGKRKKEKLSLSILDNTRIEEIEKFFKLFQIAIVLKNKNGFKVSSNKTVLEASIVEKVVAQSIDNDVKTIVTIANNPFYSEKDWIKRILEDAVYRSKDNDDKEKLIKCIVFLCNTGKFDNIYLFDIIQLISKSEEDYLRLVNLLKDENNTHLNLIKKVEFLINSENPI